MPGATIKSFFLWSIDIVTIEFLKNCSLDSILPASTHLGSLPHQMFSRECQCICETQLNTIRQIIVATEFLY